jgi:hypothetical protein
MFERLYFCQAASMAWGAAEVCGQKGLKQFQSQCGSNHLSAQTNYVHIVVFDALTGGEDVTDEPGPQLGETLFAVMDAPTPLPQSATPRSTCPLAIAFAKGTMKSG